MAVETHWDQTVDMVVSDPQSGHLLIAEVKRHLEPGSIENNEAWNRLLDYQKRTGTPYALLFTPERSYLSLPNGEFREFDSSEIFSRYGAKELPPLNGGRIAEMVLHTWLVDLTMGYSVPLPPEGFPDVRDDRVLWTA